jgi:hypothetical protein
MPPVTYSGTVYNTTTGKTEPNAKVIASRLSIKNQIYFAPADPSSQIMAETRTNAEGKFTLTTASGYAETLSVQSSDDHLFGQLDEISYPKISKGGKNLVIKISPP